MFLILSDSGPPFPQGCRGAAALQQQVRGRLGTFLSGILSCSNIPFSSLLTLCAPPLQTVGPQAGDQDLGKELLRSGSTGSCPLSARGRSRTLLVGGLFTCLPQLDSSVPSLGVGRWGADVPEKCLKATQLTVEGARHCSGQRVGAGDCLWG